MKCNIERNGSNKMASLFGPEFNYNTEEIINIIHKMYKLETIGLDFNPIEVEVAFYNCDYYVRPGEPKRRFMEEVYKIVDELKTPLKVKADSEVERALNLLRRPVLQLHAIKTFFDEEYFKEQVKRRTASTISIESQRKLRMYLRKLTRNKLEDFLNTVVRYRSEHGMFVSQVSSMGFWDKINKLCRAAGVKVPEALNTIEGVGFLFNNDGYYYKALDLKTIADMLCDAIDLDVEIASTAAEKLYNIGYDDMIHYINSNI